MIGFLLPHLLEHVRSCRVAVPQRVCKLAKNPAVFLLVLDRQRQNLSLRQVLEFFLHSAPVLRYGIAGKSGTQQNRTFRSSEPINRKPGSASPRASLGKYQSYLVLP